MQETILCYNLNKERKAQVEELAKALEIDVKHIENQDFSAPLGVLCGVLENTKNEKTPKRALKTK
ncbi:MAG: hypothetical protein ACOYIT_03805 [Christensenellales bacterium]|jgi:ABC-type transporter Mla MlaB component